MDSCGAVDAARSHHTVPAAFARGAGTQVCPGKVHDLGFRWRILCSWKIRRNRGTTGTPATLSVLLASIERRSGVNPSSRKEFDL